MEVKKRAKATGSTKSRNQRLKPEARREMIISAAAGFFAEHGLSGTLRTFSKDVRISPSLVFRYFPTKDDLIKAVYDDFILRQIDFKWLEALTDRSRPIAERLREFYHEYGQLADSETWVKVALHSGLASHGFRPYLNAYIDTLILTIAKEIAAARDPRGTQMISGDDIELVWHLHSTLNYALIRKYVHRSTMGLDIEQAIDIGLNHFLAGFEPRLN